MNERRTIFDYLAHALTTFAISVILLMMFARVFGEMSNEMSTIFQLGSKGLATETMLQFLGLSIIIRIIQYICFDGPLCSRLTVIPRMILMLAAIVTAVAIMANVCGWFPINHWEPWVGFSISFIICFLISIAVTMLKTNLENKKLEQGLKKYQEKEGGGGNESSDRNEQSEKRVWK